MPRIVVSLLLFFGLLAGPAFSQNEFKTPVVGKNVVGIQILCQDANGNAVPPSIGCPVSGSSDQVASVPGVQNAAYASGNCVGGFNAVTVTTYNGQSGYLINFRVASIGGVTPTLTAYIFDSNPSGSTCTDKGTFTLATADVDKLIALPTSVTLSAPTGTSSTFGSIDFTPPRPFTAGGTASSGVKTIYYGLVSGSIFTPASVSDIHVRAGVARN